MTTLRPFTCDDLFKFNNVNFDPLTETYGLSFYTQYLAKWPEYFQLAESPSEHIMGYIMGKVEGHMDNWHGHVTALTVSPDYRRLGLAALLMNFLEDISEKKRAYFVDLFVRKSNKVAINMYTNLGYIIYRTILEYYSGDQDEDAYNLATFLSDMRKALSRDVNKKSVIPYTQPITMRELRHQLRHDG
ncbi:hypothetical protein KR093_005927 [Drosophila rubida]|uniref:N-alpha-acetyltransferase 20 n=1 Tax=Drosophila rubida TaxID=30044 RepID=A0AAD4KB21_9MUSC|nr:hypothetical protein KR093_005927 [Drosophila rubida]